MNESKRRKREWVKTAAIVFLSVMLALTFFSSTIQNWSLPEVATQYVQSGTITAKATITGNVESVDPYEVKVTESRKVASVAVRTGSTVQKGDVLVYLEDKDSTELEKAKKDLASAQAEYNKAILSGKYTSGDISEAASGFTAESYSDRISRAQNTVEAAEKALKAAEDAKEAAEETLSAAKSAETEIMKPHDEEVARVERLIDNYQQQIDFNGDIDESIKNKLEEAKAEMADAESKLEKATTKLNDARKELNNPAGADKAQLEQNLRDAEEEHNNRQNEYDEAREAYYALENPRVQRAENNTNMKYEIAQLNVYLHNYKNSMDDLKKSAQAETERCQKQLDEREKECKAREKELNEKQEALKELIDKAGNVTGLQSYLDAIEEARKTVDELTAKAGGTTITAPISGTITSINVTAGNETSAAVPVVVMQREGQGFILKYSASNDVAKRLSVGDVGTLTNAWRYDDVTVTLASIAPDPDSRGQNKLLTFNVTGSVVAGQSLSFSIGQKSSNYNLIVPNSAIREDNNGKFILIVVSKGSPLGTRYTASRVDVQVIASDETQSAVSGALSGYEFVITTSTKPVEAGSLVRLPD